MRIRLPAFALILLVATPATFVYAQSALIPPPASDSAGIRAAALDYIEGWYTGDAARMERAVHPDLVKRIVNVDQRGRSVLNNLTAMSMVQRTRNGGGSSEIPADQRRAVVKILDIYQGVAVARIDAASWIDYLQLARWNGRWVIINVLWENSPK
jgi:hypothetical protein